MTVVRFTAGVTDGFKMKLGVNQGSALSLFLLAKVKFRLTDEVR